MIYWFNLIIIYKNSLSNYILLINIHLASNPWPIVFPKGGGGNLSYSLFTFADITLSLGNFLFAFFVESTTSV